MHLRWATPGLGRGEADTHPFSCAQYVFAHNGAIYPQDRLQQLLPPGGEARPRGTTDSELYFLLIMSKLASHEGDVVAAIADAAADIDARFEPNSLNAILLSPDALYAVNWYHPARLPEKNLQACGFGQDEIAAYFDLAYRVNLGGVVVASSGWPQPGWTPLPNRHLLVADRHTLATRVVALQHT